MLQRSIALAPSVIEKVLTGQAKQELSNEAPGVVRYLPAPQLRHVVITEAPTVVEYLPALQSVHVAEPVAVLNFPATQAAHVPPSSPEYPTTHRQLVLRLLPLREIE